MKITELRGYGIAPSDAEGNWSPEFKAKLKKAAQNIVMSHLNLKQKLQVLYWLIKGKKRASKMDLSDIRSKGMKNEAFLSQQIEYITLFSALKEVLGKDLALKIMHKVMDATAAEALLLSLPEPEDVRKVGEPMEVCRQLFLMLPDCTKKAGCHSISISQNTENAFQFDVHWCVWLELAKKMDAPEACIPNCYADDLAYPEYFKKLGINYHRTSTIAKGANICDFRFEKITN